MKLPAYRDVLKMSKEKLDDTLVPVRVIRARKQAELEMAKLEENIATITAGLQELCCQKEINFSMLIEQQNKIAISERKKRQYQKILDEMFPESYA